MNPLSCPCFDRLGRELIDAYCRVDDRDLFCVLSGQEIPNEIAVIHLAMVEHRRDCPLCRRMDHARSGVQTATPAALKERAPTVQ
jgi:hypothetical protein